MKKPYKETAVAHIPKEEVAHFNGDRLGYTDFIIKQLSAQLAERIMGILEREEEIIVRSDLRVSEYIPTDSVEYRRQINWSPLVRCEDCEFYNEDEKWCRRLGLCGAFNADGYCSHGERREDGEEKRLV